MRVRSLNTELETLNSLSPEQANAEFLKCCGSRTWARAMNEARPFGTAVQLLGTADDVWSSLSNEDWLEAFHAHPKIGEKKASTAQSEQAQKWSGQEQAGTHEASTETKAALVALPELPTVEKVASALNALGATPRDMMAIFEAMKQAGALKAELIIR